MTHCNAFAFGADGERLAKEASEFAETHPHLLKAARANKASGLSQDELVNSILAAGVGEDDAWQYPLVWLNQDGGVSLEELAAQ